ncbi:MAG: peptidoglycan DD-metalloendopeptidase family protein [Moraxellaceae bacterium]|nr:peptidoglycan DD-metalloendopeptidase family protein [Moraxellaceae bacterium]
MRIILVVGLALITLITFADPSKLPMVATQLKSTPQPGVRQSAPRHAPVNGGLAVLALPADFDSSTTVIYRNQPVWVGRISTDPKAAPVAVVGFGLDTQGEQQIMQKVGGELKPLMTVNVTKFTYPEQRLRMKETKYVSPSKQQLERYSREAQEQQAAYRVFRQEAATDAWPTFRWPLVGRLSSPFGLQRFFNDEPRAPHVGLDIAGPTGAAVVAPADAVVALTGDFFFNGRTVILDHGRGLFSMLCHFSEIAVKQGDVIKAGDLVGKVGATGRATGPHLHWTVSLNDQRIDPSYLLPSD